MSDSINLAELLKPATRGVATTGPASLMEAFDVSQSERGESFADHLDRQSEAPDDTSSDTKDTSAADADETRSQDDTAATNASGDGTGQTTPLQIAEDLISALLGETDSVAIVAPNTAGATTATIGPATDLPGATPLNAALPTDPEGLAKTRGQFDPTTGANAPLTAQETAGKTSQTTPNQLAAANTNGQQTNAVQQAPVHVEAAITRDASFAELLAMHNAGEGLDKGDGSIEDALARLQSSQNANQPAAAQGQPTPSPLQASAAALANWRTGDGRGLDAMLTGNTGGDGQVGTGGGTQANGQLAGKSGTGQARPTYGPANPAQPASIAMRIAQAVNAGDTHFDIALDPPELGRIEVKLDIQADGQARATLNVERPETLEMLQKDARTLERALAASGIELERDGLSYALNDPGGQPGRNAPDGQNSDDRQNQKTAEGQGGDEDPSASRAWRPMGAPGQLDRMV